MSKIDATPKTPAEHRVIELRKEGMSIAKIKDETDVAERRIKTLIEDIPKGKKPTKRTVEIITPLSRCIERVFPLASRETGIRDHELRKILHEEYGSTWNTSKGCYDSKFTSDNIKRVKAKVRQRAINEDCNVKFLTDWLDDRAPRSSFDFMISAASDLRRRAEEYIAEYMTIHEARQGDDSDDAVLARTKQRYATLRFLWKLAVPDYGKEPLEKLLNRSIKLVDELEGISDMEHSGHGKAEKPDYYPEPSGRNHFLDYIEAQKWI
ncbi:MULTISPECIES: hypothetical protein [Pseudomonas]|uniref:hypothetical protein n=1 Tax=Pseudomonas TaxID=286 RepID=UPI001AE7C40B|nr:MULTISPECIES: hypothetical protein [Pseudomonas]MBP2085180.1 hypothetical protein [Pseudomonas sp. PvP089]MBP2089118.1 hypothetical protein [Pseudomonas sp. PvP088]MBP2224719.1 hypothetical protein [Pseudomonas putida]MDG9812430.1 hypothetical protein [Pseudomonas putida]GLO20427.1 hypothetical protein PPUJ20188_38240 [Pseudomonas putida]